MGSPDDDTVVWLPPKVAADMSGYKRKTLCRMGDADKLTVRRVGTHRRFREDEIRALPARPGGVA